MDTKIEYNAQIGQNYQSDSSKLVNNRKRTLPPNTYSSIQTDSIKRPCLTVDTTTEPLCEALSSSESFSSTVNENVNHNSDTTATTGLTSTATTGLNDTATTGLTTTVTVGLSAYLEDIDSDEELDEIVATPPTNDKPRGKDELLSLMDQVDQDITTTEQRLMTLENKQRELIETLKQPSSTEEIPHVATATSDESGSGQHKSLIELIYTDNRIKAIGTNECLNTTPLYYQPTEAPRYWYNIQSHQQFRPDLLKYLKTRKLAQYKKECSLCVVYDQLLHDWDKKVDKWENSQKKRVREIRNRDIFEKTFPELRSKSEQLRDQAERLASNRSGVRSFGFVKSEAELNEIAYELFEQEEAKGRHSLTHANIPSMILNDKERQLQFINTNGLLRDPMILYRENKGTLLWSDNEKTTFREKFQLYPKNFEKISSYLHNKSVSDCVRYYYLAKKNSHFKSLSRRYKRRRHQIPKAHEYSLLIDQSKPRPQSDTPSISLQSHKEVSWTNDEISRLKNGLRIYGRVWGRVYKEVGGVKTATQCKQFYDDYCMDETLDLNNALAEHTERKNAERVEKKMAEMKKIPVIQSDNNNNNIEEESESDTSEPVTSQEDGECSDSETTITDSGQEEEEREVSIKPKLNPLQLSNNNNTMNEESLQSPLDIFLSAAEALSNTIPSEIALHDHTYSCPPLDIHGGSGLQLIAAAAAVVSPSLSRTTWINSSNKTTPLSNTVKAPRGRPPSTQKRNTANPQKISPSFLTPTSGVTHNVLLHDIKPTLRGRSRSAPTDKPRISLPQKNPLQSPLLLKGGTKLFTTVQQSAKGGQSPLSYSRTKEGTIVSLKSSTDTETHKLATPTTMIQSKNMPNRTRENNPVLELSIGNMALLLAAGNNQQATLLLPQSSLFNNKHTLLLCSNNRTDTTDTPTITKQTPTLSIKTSTTIPTITPLPNKPSFTLSLSSGQVRPTPVTLPRSKIYSSAPVTPVTTPTIDDLSNLNLLSNLVVGLSSTKSQSCPKPSTITTNMNPTNITTTTNNRWRKKQSIDPLTRTVSSATQQSAVMLYSRSLPLNTDTPPEEEEDHLEYATRGIDELTRLLGGTTTTTNNTTNNNGIDQDKHQSLVSWSPDELLCNPFTKDGGTNTTITVNSTTVNNTTGYVTNHTTNNNNSLLTHSTN